MINAPGRLPVGDESTVSGRVAEGRRPYYIDRLGASSSTRGGRLPNLVRAANALTGNVERRKTRSSFAGITVSPALRAEVSAIVATDEFD
jgi:hypothetical protein